MKRIGVTEWQATLGQLRQETEPLVVKYRQRPTAIQVPIPPTYWTDSAPFFTRLMQLRDQHLRPPARESAHNWALDTYIAARSNVVEARRGTAQIFGRIVFNEPVILTYYDYDSAIMIPLPPDFSEHEIDELGEQIREYMKHIQDRRDTEP